MAQSTVNERDDVPSTHDNLERLLHRFREPDSPTLTTIRSIVERLSAELAFQRGDYPSALEHIANAVGSFFDSDEYPQPSFFPTLGGWRVPEWVDRAEELAKGYVAHLRESRGGDVDWPALITCCERLKRLYSDDRWPVVNHPPYIAHEGTGFWDETIGWLHAQLAPDQLRGLYEERIRRAAESRPSRYIFADGIWAKLSEKARDELITADSTWMADGSENRLATILNPVQRATEDTLYHLFWAPIMHWARGRDEEYGWLSSLLGNRNFPGLTDYLRVLSSPTSITYFLVQPGAQGRVATGLLILPVAEHAGGSRAQGFFPGLNLAGMGPGTWTWYLAASWATVSSSFTASRTTLALNAGLCFLRHLDISHSSLAATAALSLGAELSLSYLSSFPGPPHYCQEPIDLDKLPPYRKGHGVCHRHERGLAGWDPTNCIGPCCRSR